MRYGLLPLGSCNHLPGVKRTSGDGSPQWGRSSEIEPQNEMGSGLGLSAKLQM